MTFDYVKIFYFNVIFTFVLLLNTLKVIYFVLTKLDFCC